MLTADRLRELLCYDRQTGVWVWRVPAHKGRWKAGRVAGSIQNNGYRVIRIDGHLYLSSRLAFLYVTGTWPPNHVDHRDTNPSNDAWNNLRPATRSQNMHNMKLSRRNRSGFKGVFWNAQYGKWQARIARVYLGRFDTPELAHAAYCKAAKERFGDYARFH